VRYRRKTFTFAISSPDEFLSFVALVLCQGVFSALSLHSHHAQQLTFLNDSCKFRLVNFGFSVGLSSPCSPDWCIYRSIRYLRYDTIRYIYMRSKKLTGWPAYIAHGIETKHMRKN